MKKNNVLIRLYHEAQVDLEKAIDMSNPDEETRGYVSFQGRCEIQEGEKSSNYEQVKSGIEKLVDVSEREIKKREEGNSKFLPLELKNIYSEIGQAQHICGRLASTLDQKIRDYDESKRFYKLSLEEGKKDIEIMGYLGYSLFKLAQYTLEVGNKEEAKFHFEEALDCSEEAKSMGDPSREIRSKIGNISLELALLEYHFGDLVKTQEYVFKAEENIRESMNLDFAFAYVLRARLSDFVNDDLLKNEVNKREELKEIGKYGWRTAVPKIFELEKKGIIQFKKYPKGTSPVFELVEENFPIRYSFILKGYNNEADARLEFLMTRAINQASKHNGGEFSRPLLVLEHEGVPYMVIERNSGRDLDTILRGKGEGIKAESARLILEELAKFHRYTTEEFSKDGFRLKDELDASQNYQIPEFDYFSNFIERTFVKSYSSPRNEERVEKLCKVAREEDIERFDSLEKRDFFKTRIPFSSGTHEFLVEYYKFIEKNLGSILLDTVLHGDYHLNNILERGFIIDNKPLQRGNRFFDVSHVLLHPHFRFLTEDDKLEMIASSYLGFSHTEQTIKEYKFNVLHNSICLTGAMINQKNSEEAQYYLRESIKMISDLGENELLESFVRMIHSTGRGDLLEVVEKRFEDRERLRIGVDFDGVIADSTGLKIKYAKKVCGIKLKPEHCSKGKAAEVGMSKEQYEEMIDALYGTDECLRMREVPRVKEVLEDMVNQGHEVFIITSRTDEEVRFAGDWLEIHQIPHTGIINTNNTSKLEACREQGVEIYIDDSYSKLVPLIDEEIELYLFSTPTNKDVVAKVRRMGRWDELYTIVNCH